MNAPLGGHFKLSEVQTPTTKDEKALMSKVPYALAVSSLMYVMVCKIKYCSSSVSCQHIHEQAREGALESCEVNLEISEG